MNRYICAWEGPDNPTAHMTEAEAADYWRAHSVRGDVAFALADPLVPEPIKALWAALARDINDRTETAEHRRRAATIRTYYRTWASLCDPYPRPVETFDAYAAECYLETLPAPGESKASSKPEPVNWKARALAAESALATLRAKTKAKPKRRLVAVRDLQESVAS